MRLPQLLVAGALLLSFGGYVAVPHPAERQGASPWPDAQELDTLARYVSTVAAPPPAEGEFGVPLPPPGALLGEAPDIDVLPPPRAAIRQRSVSAILIMGDRRVAVIDETTVRPGDRMPDGTRVLGIEANRVVLGEVDGRRTILQL